MLDGRVELLMFFYFGLTVLLAFLLAHSEYRADWKGERLHERYDKLRSQLADAEAQRLVLPFSWNWRDCKAIDCLAFSEHWALGDQDCDSCWCAHQHLPPEAGSLGRLCEDLMVEGPNGESLEPRLAWAWAVAQNAAGEYAPPEQARGGKRRDASIPLQRNRRL